MGRDNGHTLSSNEDCDNSLFNPFVGYGGESLSMVIDTNAISRGRASKQVSGLRRRTPGSSVNPTTSASGRHTRSKTEIYATSNQSLGSLHPLRSAGLSEHSDAGVTRPNLSRMMKVGTLVDVTPSIEPDHTSIPLTEEKNVLVHEIKPGDSLAGISLKYGITMTNLRRANHLWASDSIHLRTVLYIPIDEASRLRTLPAEYNLISMTPAEEISDPLEPSIEHQDKQDSLFTQQPTVTNTIRRVPASHLSFFPPASVNKSTTRERPSPYVQQPISYASNSISTHSRYTSSPSHSLTSLLTALPIAASTRDTIISRLSYDSVSSSYNDKEEKGEILEGLELDDVRHTSRQSDSPGNHAPDFNGTHSSPVTTPKASHRTPKIREHPTISQSASQTEHSHIHMQRFSSSPQAYIPSHPQICTAQLEPSPGMRLPLSKAGSPSVKGKTRASQLDVALETANNGA